MCLPLSLGGIGAIMRIEKIIGLVNEKYKGKWEKSYGEGTQFDLDYGKLLILGLCIYIAIQVS